LLSKREIQGDIRLSVNTGVITVISGHPLLAPIYIVKCESILI